MVAYTGYRIVQKSDHLLLTSSCCPSRRELALTGKGADGMCLELTRDIPPTCVHQVCMWLAPCAAKEYSLPNSKDKK